MSLSSQPTRKRFRNSYDEETSEFTPLSKRINNLHINADLKRVLLKQEMELGAGFDVESRNVDCAHSLPSPSEIYSPNLTASENPYYYESNRLLFQLHLERVHRSETPSSEFPPP